MSLASALPKQLLVAGGVIAVGAVLAIGATSIPAEAGYAGVGPNFLPWTIAAALIVCGVWLLWEAVSGGFRSLDPASGAEQSDWRALAWVSAGVLANAALVTRAGFVLSCALCFALAVRGMRVAEGRAGGGLRQALIDAASGLAITLPVYWLFTKLLAINLPGLTGTGWL